VYSITSAAGSGQEKAGSGQEKLYFCRKWRGQTTFQLQTHRKKNVFLYDVERTNYTSVGNRQKNCTFVGSREEKLYFFL
jgi:hypothetical protein